MRKVSLFLTCALLVIVLAACANESPSHEAVENYLAALVEKDQDGFVNLYCPTFEAEARTEFDSFGAVDAELEDVSCSESQVDGDTALVTCTGQIALVYQGADSQELSLANNVYRVERVDGEWKMCGYE